MRKLVMAGALAGVVLLGGGIAAGAASADTSKSVVLEVGGQSGHTTVTYSVSGSSAASGTTVKAGTPWSKTVRSSDSAPKVSLKVQPGDGGRVTCKVTVDGAVVSTGSASGKNSQAWCEANQNSDWWQWGGFGQ